MIEVEVHGDVGRLLLARPEKRNALTPRMLTDLAQQAASLSRRCRVIVLEGRGDVFCAGFDLTLCRDNSGALRDLLSGLSDAIRSLRSADAPVVAAVRSAAIAGGCALLGGADLVVTHDDAKLGYPVVRLGISPAVSAPTLAAAAGAGPARALLLDGRIIRGSDAARIGLVEECVASDGDVGPRALEIADQLAAKPAEGLRRTRSWLNELDGAGDQDLQAALNVSLSLVGSVEERDRLTRIWNKS